MKASHSTTSDESSCTRASAFFYGPSPSTERIGFVGKERAGMEGPLLRGHNMSRSSLTVTAVAALIWSKWGDAGDDHPSFGDLPAGLVDTVTWWVSSRS